MKTNHSLRAVWSLTLMLLPVAPPVCAQGGAAPQVAVATVERMPRLPRPLAVRDWRDVARRYYDHVLDPAATGDSFPVVRVSNDRPGFAIKDYVGSKPATEALTCLSAVVGAKLVGLNPERLHGVNYVTRAQAWYDPKLGLYRNTVVDRSSVVHADIYGYWPAILGMMLASQYPHDATMRAQTGATCRAFLQIAHGLGAPDRPDYDVLGWDFAAGRPGGRPDPNNRVGHAPSVAWPLMVGAGLTGDPEMLRCARATMQWYIDHPGRYDLSHVMGPLTAARLNAHGGPPLDMTRVLNAWFGDGDSSRHPFFVTSGTGTGALTTDGLDGARWPQGEFYAFTMGTLQDPAWLVPVARYDPRYARAIARYALNAANSARLLQGVDLDADHQDHAAWKARWDKDNLLFYESLMSSDPASHAYIYSGTPPPPAPPAHPLRPYATGDPVMNSWDTGHPKVAAEDYLRQRAQWFGDTPHDLGLYGGNSVGFLGGIEAATDVPGILRWDCVATDWFHPAALPTFLYYNPYDKARMVTVPLDKPASLYDVVSGNFVAVRAKTGYHLKLKPDQAVVLVEVRPGAKITRWDTRLLADGIVIDYNFRAAAIRSRLATEGGTRPLVSGGDKGETR